VKFNSSGDLLASAGADGKLHIRSVANGTEHSPVTHPRAEVRCVAYSIDGRGRASGDSLGKVIIQYDNTQWTIVRPDKKPVSCVAFLPTDSSLLAFESGSASAVQLYDVQAQKFVGTTCNELSSVNSTAEQLSRK